MLFNSWAFLGLVLLTLVSYYLLPKLRCSANAQVGLLFVASLVFYAYETPVLVALLLLSITVNYYASRRIVLSSSPKSIKGLVLWSVVFNVAVIAFFKYGELICSTILPTGAFADDTVRWLSEIPLPIGISFYTFQAISLIIDLKRQGKMSNGMEKLERDFLERNHTSSFLNIGFYIAFFPQLIAGPIVKAHDFIKQISVKRFSEINWEVVVRSLIVGYFLKMYVADNLKDVTGLLSMIGEITFSKGDLLIFFYAYSLQIFADFAGYSLIAIGLGALFGYKLPTNFNFPYISSSLTDFWRRWHISLSSWLREYLYIPLGGNRKGALRTYLNLMIVMLIGGLWHGSAWSYMVWGGVHGLFLALERLYTQNVKPLSFQSSKWMQILKMLVVFHVVSVLWLLFVMPDFTDFLFYFEALSSGSSRLGSPQNLFSLLIYGGPVVLYHLYAYVREDLGRKGKEIRSRRMIEPLVLSVLLFLVILNSGTTGAFIYFQF